MLASTLMANIGLATGDSLSPTSALPPISNQLSTTLPTPCVNVYLVLAVPCVVCIYNSHVTIVCSDDAVCGHVSVTLFKQHNCECHVLCVMDAVADINIMWTHDDHSSCLNIMWKHDGYSNCPQYYVET